MVADSKSLYSPPHPVSMTFSSLEKAKGFRETDTDTYMGREKPEKMADGIETGMDPSERLSVWEERTEQLLLTSFLCEHPFQSMSSAGWDTLIFKT